ncbi:MAG: PilZ domain-containing protein [Candidatus Omnitrophota bacterium]
MMWDGINQRRFPRVSYRCLILVSKDGREEVIETFTENIGAGGICVVLDREFKLFENVAMEIFLGEEKEPINCQGTIVWVVKRHPTTDAEKVEYDTGVEFRDISDEDIKKVTKLVEDILKAKT